MPRVTLNGCQLYFEEHGTGDTVVISAQRAFFDEGYPRRLALPPTAYRVFTLVIRGFLPTARINQSLGERWYPAVADDVVAFARQRGLGRFIYTGVSHGAVVGWHVAVQRPEALRALVSVVGAPHHRERPLAPSVPGPHDPDHWAAHTGRAFPDLRNEAELTAALGRIRVPTLILGGLDDPLCQPEDNLLAARAVPGAKLVLWHGVGRSLPQDRREAVVEEVKHFMDELGGS